MRVACGLIALFIAMPALLIGAFALDPQPGSESLFFPAMAVFLWLTLFGFAALAISGRNPLRRLDVAAAKMRAEAEAASQHLPKPSISKRILWGVVSIAVMLLINWAITEGLRNGIAALFK